MSGEAGLIITSWLEDSHRRCLSVFPLVILLLEFNYPPKFIFLHGLAFYSRQQLITYRFCKARECEIPGLAWVMTNKCVCVCV